MKRSDISRFQYSYVYDEHASLKKCYANRTINKVRYYSGTGLLETTEMVVLYHISMQNIP